MSVQFGIGKMHLGNYTLGHLQNFSLDFSFDEATLYGGTGLYPVDVRVHSADVGGSAEFADINAFSFQKLLGGTRTGGSTAIGNTSYPGNWELTWIMDTDNIDFIITAYKCRSNKLSFSFSRENYVIPSFDFKCYSNDDGNIFIIDIEDWS